MAPRWRDAYVADTTRLGLGPPMDSEPRVTGTVSETIRLADVERSSSGVLPSRGTATCTSRRRRLPAPTVRLRPARRTNLLQEGGVEPGEGKQSPLDFALR